MNIPLMYYNKGNFDGVMDIDYNNKHLEMSQSIQAFLYIKVCQIK